MVLSDPAVTVRPAGRSWLESLPGELERQRRLLERLIEWCEADEAVSWLAVGCSLASGRADKLSDLDVALGARPGEKLDVAARLADRLPSFGELVGHYAHDYGPVGLRRLFAQYADRTQIDAVVVEEERSRLVNVVALYDREGHLTVLERQPAVEPATVFVWASQGWEELLNVGKYLRRGALWEARQRLEEARQHLFQLWAVLAESPEPGYGITALFDLEPVPELPAEIGATLAGLGRAELLAAARRLAELLSQTGEEIGRRLSLEVPRALASFTEADLALLEEYEV